MTCHDRPEEHRHRLLEEIAALRLAIVDSDDAGQVMRLQLVLSSRERELFMMPARAA